MKKKAYSLLSMALSLLLIMGTVAVPVMAENVVGPWGRLSSTVYDFTEGLEESAYYDTSANSGDVTTDGRDIRIEQVTDKNGITKSALTLNPVREEEDSTPVSSYYQLITYYSGTYDNWRYQTKYAIDFSICRADETTAYYGLMGSNGDNYELVGFNGGYITMFGNPVAKYNVNEWLNVQFRIDCNTKTATLKLRPANSNNDAEWKTYKTSFDTVPRAGFTTYPKDIMATANKGFNKIVFGSYVQAPAAQKNMKIAISDLCQNSHTDTIDPGFDNVNDDFERVSVETVAKTISGNKMDNNKDDAVNANKNVWLTTDATDTTFSIDALGEENHALKAVTASESAKNPALYCVPFTLNQDVRHHISLKLGGTQKNHGEYVFRLYYCEDDIWHLAYPIYDYKYWDAVKIGKNKITVNGVAYNVELPENELCDIDVIYDNKTGMAVVRVQANGQTLCEIDRDNLNINNEKDWKWHVKGISIMNTNATDDTMYVDDFVWDVQERVAGSATASYLADGKTEGYLDEEVSLTLNAPVLDEKMIGASAVTAGGIVIPAYTTKISEDGKTVTVKFNDLTPNTEYTVNVFAFSDAETLIPTVGTTAAFTTNNITDFAVTDLDYSNGTGSATVTSGYKNPPVTMLAALYDDEGRMVDRVKIAQKGETVITPGFTAEGSKVRLFVWSDLVTMIPYLTEEFPLN